MQVTSKNGPPPLARFYTKPAISELLVSSMRAERPGTIIDLGAGDGSLSLAARRRWSDAAIVTVDLDSGACPRMHEATGVSFDPRHRHLRLDALDSDLPHRLIALGRTFDAGVCNPPYALPRWRPSFAQILEDAGLLPGLPVVAHVSTDVLFIAQNLRMLRDGGEVGLVVPDSLITGSRMKTLRQLLLKRHRIEIVVQLPRTIFTNTDAQTYILILRKGLPSDSPVEIRRLFESAEMSAPLLVDKTAAIERLDFEFHAARFEAASSIPEDHTFTLGSIGAEVCRGSLNSRQARDLPFAIFHVQHFPRSAKDDFHVPSQLCINDDLAQACGTAVGRPGDILLARVGRGLEKKICCIRSGQVALSDWIYRIRIESKWRRLVMDALLSGHGQKVLAAHARGVGAIHIPKAALLKMPLRKGPSSGRLE